MVLMDKIKEHSCAIQPAFGFGGLNQLNFAFLFQQLLNPEPLAAVEETLELPPIDGTDQFNPTDLQPQVTTGVVDDPFEQGHVSIEQLYQNQINQQYNLNIGMTGNIQQNPVVSTQQNVAGTVANEFNTLNLVNLTTMLNNSVAVQLLDGDESDDSDVPIYMHQPHAPAPTPNIGSGTYQPHTATAPLPATHQMIEINALHQLLPHFVEQNPPHQLPGLQLINPNNTAYIQLIEESNSSIPFFAPASTPNYNESSEDEDCAPSVVSDIIVIDSAGDSDSDNNENKNQ